MATSGDDPADLAHANAALKEHARQQAAIAMLGELAMNTQDVAPLLLAACATSRDVLGVDAAAVLEPEDGGCAVRAALGLPPGVVGASFDCAWARAAFEPGVHGALAVEDVTARFGPQPSLEAHGIRSLVAAVFPSRDRPAGGVLAVFSRTRRAFTPGEVRWIETAAGVVAAASARSRAERELLERERQLRAVFDAANDAMLIVDARNAVLEANPAASLLFGKRRGELLGRSLAALSGGTVPPGLFAKGRHDGEWPLPAAAGGGRPRSVEYSTIPEILPGRGLLVLRDVTEHRQLQARLALADRLVSVGTLAAGVAHELNNPLAYVNANLSFVAEHLGAIVAAAGNAEGSADDVAQVIEAIRDAREGAARMRVIIRDLKTFSRPDEEKARAVDVGTVLESCIAMAWNEIRHRARLVRHLDPVPPVFGSDARLAQVFLNLLVNAAQAIPEGVADEHHITVATRVAPDGRVAVEVADTGSGIRPEIRGRIFDPFFTTKPPGVGTGLGLSICHSIVGALGGEIQVEAGQGGGTTFRVLLPPSDDAPVTTPALAPAPVTRRGRLLVFDDEQLVCTVLQRTLGAEHDVVVADRARAALDLLDQGERFDLVISDLLMPEMTGMDLHRELVKRYPQLARRVVFLTGGAFTSAARAFLDDERVECIEKPFDLATIRAVIARRLAAD